MAVHRQPEQAGADLGPRWQTVVSLETPFPDVDPGEALRRVDRNPIDWRIEAREQYSTIVANLVADILRKEADRQFLAEWTARFEAGDTREADQFQAWLEHALREGNLETQLAIIDEIPAPPYWLQRYTAYVRYFRDSTAKRLAWFEGRSQAVDTGTIFYDPARWR
jgi:hypothetical protein